MVEEPEVTVSTDELCAMVASGPRGEAARRVRTHATRVEVQLGPCRIVVLVHGTLASDPLGAAIRRVPWLPLTVRPRTGKQTAVRSGARATRTYWGPGEVWAGPVQFGALSR